MSGRAGARGLHPPLGGWRYPPVPRASSPTPSAPPPPRAGGKSAAPTERALWQHVQDAMKAEARGDEVGMGRLDARVVEWGVGLTAPGDEGGFANQLWVAPEALGDAFAWRYGPTDYSWSSAKSGIQPGPSPAAPVRWRGCPSPCVHAGWVRRECARRSSPLSSVPGGARLPASRGCAPKDSWCFRWRGVRVRRRAGFRCDGCPGARGADGAPAAAHPAAPVRRSRLGRQGAGAALRHRHVPGR